MNYALIWGGVAIWFFWCNRTLQAKLRAAVGNDDKDKFAFMDTLFHQKEPEVKWISRWSLVGHALLVVSILYALSSEYALFAFFFALCQISYYQSKLYTMKLVKRKKQSW